MAVELFDGSTSCIPGLGLRYTAFSTSLPFQLAIFTCSSFGPGGQIAVLQDDKMFQEVLIPLQNQTGKRAHWIGLRATITPERDPSNFLNLDGTRNSFTGNVGRGEFPWAEELEPSINSNNADTCVFMDLNRGSLLNDDSDCTRPRRFICELSCSVAEEETASPTFLGSASGNNGEGTTIILMLLVTVLSLLVLSVGVLFLLQKQLNRANLSQLGFSEW